MLKAQNGKREPLWRNLLVFTRADGKLFMLPIFFNQYNEYPQDLHHNIPLDWTVHHKPYGYMNRDRWLKAMTQLYNICGAYPVNNKILFFDGNDINFGDHTLTQTQRKKSALYT